MLALKDQNGVVESSVPGLADLARVSLEDLVAALEKLKKPDQYSRTKEFEGRRIEEVDGGWLILNHQKYRAKMNQDERREYLRVKQQEHRDRQKRKTGEVVNSPTVKPTKKTDEEFLKSLEENPAYSGVNIQVEFGKARAWCEVNQRKLTQRFFVNWINKDRPMKAGIGGVVPVKTATVFELTKVIEAKETLAKSIRGKFCSDVAMGQNWSDESKRQEFVNLKREVKELTQKLGAMA